MKLEGHRVLAGAWGTLHWDGESIAEVEKVEATIKINREDVIVGLDKDNKMTSVEGEGSFAIYHVYTRGVAKLLDAIKKGQDSRGTISAAINDPDATGGQRERVNLNNVAFNELPLVSWTKGELGKKEYSFTFTPTDTQISEAIM